MHIVTLSVKAKAGNDVSERIHSSYRQFTSVSASIARQRARAADFVSMYNRAFS